MTRLRIAAGFAACLALAGCYYVSYKVDRAPFPAGVSQKQMEQIFIDAAAHRDWKIARVGPGHFELTYQKVADYKADLYYTATDYSITPRSAANETFMPGTWIRNLKDEIDQETYATVRAR